ERLPTIATTASAPRSAASCSRPARESPVAPAPFGPSTISVLNPAEVSSPLSRTSVSTITGGPLAGRTISTLAAHAGVATNRQVAATAASTNRPTRDVSGRAHERPRRPRVRAIGETPEILLGDRARPRHSLQLARQRHLASQRLRRVRALRRPREVRIVPFDGA